jgi:hypothetical protein
MLVIARRITHFCVYFDVREEARLHFVAKYLGAHEMQGYFLALWIESNHHNFFFHDAFRYILPVPLTP